jgi:DNA-binding MarR family transcriptional regulator
MVEPESGPTPLSDEMKAMKAGLLRMSQRCEKFDVAAVYALISLKRMSADLDGFVDKMCKTFDFSSGRLNVLMALFSADNQSMALSEIGRYLVVTRPNITGLIDGLVSDGLVERVDHPEDRRLIIAHLTEHGKEFMHWFVPQHIANVSELMGALNQDELRQLAHMIERLRERMRTANFKPYGEFKPESKTAAR